MLGPQVCLSENVSVSVLKLKALQSTPLCVNYTWPQVPENLPNGVFSWTKPGHIRICRS